MTISIWIIVIAIVSVGFWFYYKKHKKQIQSIPKKNNAVNNKYSLTDIDKMLEHVTKKEKPIQEKSDSLQIEDSKKESNELVKEKFKKNTSLFDPENSIISSIILKKKDL